MSKIQDALNKLQSGRASVSSRREFRRPVESLGSLVAAADWESGDGESRPLVVLDRDRLRAAGLLAPTNLERSLADEYRRIKRPLLDLAAGRLADTADGMNLIMIASALPGDGKSFTCINLALSMAQEKDTTVLLVDGDVAKPQISGLFGLDDEPGLIDLLTDDQLNVVEVTLRTDVPGLRVIPAGQRHENATELLASKRMSEVVTQLAEQYTDRIVIFDSPPLLATSEAHVLASLVGQIVFVVCADRTPRQAVLDSLDALDSSKAISLVLNQAGAGVESLEYGQYGYGADFRYGENEKQA